ncbi:MAG: hypothetical protein C0469_00490 [Cyanobacteria bacterium DS2.3.42]|nr:hypothetical protein [Cyanobacteria bacterium DS2.3.42]
MSGVIGGEKNQEVHGQANAVAHANDKTLSEPDMIAMEEHETPEAYKARVAQIQANRFGFFDSEKDNAGDAGAGKTKIHEHPAKQAVEPLPSLSPTMQQPPYESAVKANVQITNVPEVSEAVQQEVLGKYAETVLENAAAAVRQVENHLAQPNAINNDFLKAGQWAAGLPEHFAQSPSQLDKDVQGALSATMDEIDKPLSVDERARKAGILLPMFFFESGKEPINPETIEQMGLEGMTEAELKALGIEKRVEEIFTAEEVETEMLESKGILQGSMEASEAATRKSIHDKVTGYLFNPENERGWAKGEWFRRALGFEAANPEHMAMLERQIKFDSDTAVTLPEREWGPRWKQDQSITGPSGKSIDGVRVIWQRDRDGGIMRVITIMPPK